MGQTLTHGVYLPDEGERNCYSGLAANWQILDGSVGTIAAHTAALAGKAPLVHTHTKSDITDFPAYGTTAGTICEGNDSRLSDARTPVAHTHGKSDITDLFNTDNTYGANQNFKNSGWEQGVTPAKLTSLYLQFIDKNNSSFGAIGFHQDSNGYTFLNILAGDKYANGAKSTNGSLIRNQFRLGTTSAGITYQSFDGYWGSSLTPLTNNTYDLGSSSYQWNNLYAKNYYYNGVAWGLDQNNTWTGANTFSDSSPIRLKNNNIEKGVQPTVFQAQNILFKDKNNSDVANIRHIVTASGTNSNADGLEFSVANKFANGALDPTGTNTVGTFRIGFWTDGQKYIYNEFKWRSSLIPFNNQTQDIGTSANQWNNLYAKKVNTQSVNGINPGALSLPNSPGGTGTENVNYYDLSSIVTIRDGSGVNSYQPVCDGWIAINSFATWIQIANDTTLVCVTGAIGADGFGQCYLPVRKNDNIRIVINQTNTNFQSFKLIPCQGNV